MPQPILHFVSRLIILKIYACVYVQRKTIRCTLTFLNKKVLFFKIKNQMLPTFSVCSFDTDTGKILITHSVPSKLLSFLTSHSIKKADSLPYSEQNCSVVFCPTLVFTSALHTLNKARMSLSFESWWPIQGSNRQL